MIKPTQVQSANFKVQSNSQVELVYFELTFHLEICTLNLRP
jgi:hypothetical protein